VNDLCVVCTEKSERPNSRSKSKIQLTGHYQVVIERKSPSRDGLVKPIYATTQPQLLIEGGFDGSGRSRPSIGSVKDTLNGEESGKDSEIH